MRDEPDVVRSVLRQSQSSNRERSEGKPRLSTWIAGGSVADLNAIGNEWVEIGRHPEKSTPGQHARWQV